MGILIDMALLILLLILTLPYLALTLANRLLPGFMTERAARLRAGLSLLLGVTGSVHFTRAALMAEMLPPAFPWREGAVYLFGLLEFAGAIAIWVPSLRRAAGLLLIVLLVVFVPVNVYAARNLNDFGNQVSGPAYLAFRIPFQMLLIWWTYYATQQRWLHRRIPPASSHESASPPCRPE